MKSVSKQSRAIVFLFGFWVVLGCSARQEIESLVVRSGPNNNDHRELKDQTLPEKIVLKEGSLHEIKGTLLNQTENYFIGLALYIQGKEGQAMPVKPWLPLEIPPLPPLLMAKTKQIKKVPLTLKDYIGKPLKIRGVIRGFSKEAPHVLKSRFVNEQDQPIYLEVEAAILQNSQQE